MNKETEKRLTELIAFLKELNESDLPMNIDFHLNNDKSKVGKSKHHSSMCKMYFIHEHGVIKEDCQNKLNDAGFAIEKYKGSKDFHFFIQTEKGILTF